MVWLAKASTARNNRGDETYCDVRALSLFRKLNEDLNMHAERRTGAPQRGGEVEVCETISNMRAARVSFLRCFAN